MDSRIASEGQTKKDIEGNAVREAPLQEKEISIKESTELGKRLMDIVDCLGEVLTWLTTLEVKKDYIRIAGIYYRTREE